MHYGTLATNHNPTGKFLSIHYSFQKIIKLFIILFLNIKIL
uniref:Uncharacterized protein n=1 Tax=Manihot esculenta TaxID=3983 RepID=A0A2C9UXL2_MANES